MARKSLPEVVKIRRMIAVLSTEEIEELQDAIEIIVEVREGLAKTSAARAAKFPSFDEEVGA